jgi:hypothetical protein
MSQQVVMPGTLGWAVLAELVSRPGQDVASLARACNDWRPPPATTLAELRARQEALRAEFRARPAAGTKAAPRSLAARKAREQVSRAVERLVLAGLVEARAGVTLDPWTAKAWQERGEASLARREHVERAGVIEAAVWVPAAAGDVAIVRALLDGPLPQNELAARSGGLTSGGQRSGVWLARYAALVEDGVLVPPGDRWPTPAGRALIEGAQHEGEVAAR